MWATCETETRPDRETQADSPNNETFLCSLHDETFFQLHFAFFDPLTPASVSVFRFGTHARSHLLALLDSLARHLPIPPPFRDTGRGRIPSSSSSSLRSFRFAYFFYHDDLWPAITLCTCPPSINSSTPASDHGVCPAWFTCSHCRQLV